MESLFGKDLPKDMKSRLRTGMGGPREVRLRSLRRWKQWLKALKDTGTRKKSDEGYAKAEPHVGEV